MELYILRHAIAVERGTTEHDESRRPLTPEGRKKMRLVAKGMKVLGLSFDWIISSPLVRARATATIVADVLKLQRKVKYTAHLEPEGAPRLLIEYLSALHGSPQRLLLVGHEPDLSQLVSLLIGGRGSVGLKFKKGGLCKVSTEDLTCGRCAVMEWLCTPRQLALLGRCAKRGTGN